MIRISYILYSIDVGLLRCIAASKGKLSDVMSGSATC